MRPGALVTRQELRDHVWPGDTFVDFDLAINQAIKQIRAVLNDDAERPRIIATLPRRGYRFIAKAETTPAPEISSRPPLPDAPQTAEPLAKSGAAPSRRRRWVILAVAIVATALLLAALVGYRSARSSGQAGQVRLVVLPFENLTGDPGQEYFADGMTEEMIAQLGAMDPNRLGVIARTSAVKYKNSGKGIDQIGQETGVDYVLEGS